jgi:uncharacterized SAM-binding protein YcdF (DUF218 family)
LEIIFILKKTIGFLLQPYGLILSCFLIFIISYAWGKKLLATLSFILGVSFYVLFAHPLIANFLSSHLENMHPKYANQIAKYITVMGNRHSESPLLPQSSVLSDAGTKHTLEAVMIYNQMVIKPHIIFTGYSGFNNQVSFAQTAANFAQALGVSQQHIIISGTEKDSDNEAQTVQRITKNNPTIVVTSAMHMPRTIGLFKKYNINIIPAPTDFKTNNKGLWSLPRLNYLQQSNYAVHEYLGIFLEKLKQLWKNLLF